MKRLLMSIAVSIVLSVPTAQGAIADSPPSIPSVPPNHPRVYVRAADLPSIIAKLQMPEFSEDWSVIRKDRRPLSRAFVYLMTGDRKTGRTAITESLSALKKCTDARTPDNAMHWGACVYDWCHNLISSSEKQEFINEFIRIALSHGPGYPANPDSHAVVGHGTEGWLLTDQLPAGLAIYDESPQMFDAAARLFFDKFIQVRNFFYPSHMHHQGDSYTGTRLQHDLLAGLLFRCMGAGDVFTSELQYVPYQHIYHLRPDGQQMRSGDTYDDSGRSNSKRRLMLLAGAYYEDPYLLTMADSDFFRESSSYDRIFKLLFRNPGLEKRPIEELPLSKYFSPPMGEMIARTGWKMGIESSDAVIHMRIGEYFFGNHQRKDFGTFQIYCRGPLAIASGLYQGKDQAYGSAHWLNYHHQTIAHNGLLIYDPAEKMAKGSANDGGQRWPNNGVDHPKDMAELTGKDYRMGQVTAHAVGPDQFNPVYSYIAGDITAAYAAGKVEKVTRSMVTLNTNNPAAPCVLVVFDRVLSTNPSFRKTWLLHSIQEPEIQHRTATIYCNLRHYENNQRYGGKLIVESLMPEEVSITKIGGPGKEFWVESTQSNYTSTKGGAAEPGAWRVEISPGREAYQDTFLHILTTMDDSSSGQIPAGLISGTNLVGASIPGFAILFSSDGQLLQTAEAFLDGSEERTVFVCDLRPGLWSVEVNGESTGTVRITPQAKSFCFAEAKGLFRMDYLSP